MPYSKFTYSSNRAGLNRQEVFTSLVDELQQFPYQQDKNFHPGVLNTEKLPLNKGECIIRSSGSVAGCISIEYCTPEGIRYAYRLQRVMQHQMPLFENKSEANDGSKKIATSLNVIAQNMGNRVPDTYATAERLSFRDLIAALEEIGLTVVKRPPIETEAAFPHRFLHLLFAYLHTSTTGNELKKYNACNFAIFHYYGLSREANSEKPTRIYYWVYQNNTAPKLSSIPYEKLLKCVKFYLLKKYPDQPFSDINSELEQVVPINKSGHRIAEENPLISAQSLESIEKDLVYWDRQKPGSLQHDVESMDLSTLDFARMFANNSDNNNMKRSSSLENLWCRLWSTKEEEEEQADSPEENYNTSPTGGQSYSGF